MEIPFGSFFEVTINAEKLNGFIDDIFKLMKSQDNKIEQYNSALTNITGILSQRIKKQETNLQYQVQKLKRMSQEQINYLNLYAKDCDKKNNERMDELENNVMTINNKIRRTKEDLEEDVQMKVSYIQNKITFLSQIDANTNKLMREMEVVDTRLKEAEASIKKNIEEMEASMRLAMAQESQYIRRKSVDISEEMMHKYEQEYKERLSRNSILDDHTIREKKKRRYFQFQEENEQREELQYVSDKISSIADAIMHENANTSNVKTYKMSEFYKANSKEELGKDQNSSQKHIHFNKKEFENNLLGKLEKINVLMTEKYDNMCKELLKLGNKNEIIDEQVGILTRKLQKDKTKFNDLNVAIKKCEEKRVDQKMIESLKASIKKFEKEYEENLEIRITKEQFDRERNRIYQKIHIVNEALMEKSEKSDLKKAFSFLQEKIKEIIIVIAEDQNNEKDGAGKRKQFKCLSCDKDLQANPTAMKPLPFRESSNTMRCQTNQIRKRIRVLNNSLTPSEQNA